MEHAFPSGAVALDFVGTLRARRNAVPWDMLGSPESLDSWFRESGTTDGGTNCKASDVEEAVALREAIYLLVTARLANESYDEEALALVNRAASAPPAIPQLTPAGRRIEATPQQALSSVARDAIDILSGVDMPLLKECANPECTQIYIDRSRGARRVVRHGSVRQQDQGGGLPRPQACGQVGISTAVSKQRVARSKAVDLDDGCGKGLRGLLREIVADALQGPVGVWAREAVAITGTVSGRVNGSSSPSRVIVGREMTGL